MFQNPEITLDELPEADAVDWQALHPLYARSIRIVGAFILSIFVVVITALLFVPTIPWFVHVILYAALVLIGIPILVWPSVAVPRRGYVLRDRDLLFRKGVVWRSVTAVPFNRIQHVETSSTPLDRKLGLATLQLFTAGGSGADLKIDGLGKDVAEQLRIYILDKAGASIENA